MSDVMKVVVCQLQDQTYGIDVQHVLSIEEMTMLTPVPNTSPFIKGILYMRGDMIPVIDLKERLQLDTYQETGKQRIVIISIDDTKVGFIVDDATDVIDIDRSVVEEAPDILGQVDNTFIQGVAKLKDSILILFDLAKVLDFDETNEIKQVKDSVTEQNND